MPGSVKRCTVERVDAAGKNIAQFSATSSSGEYQASTINATPGSSTPLLAITFRG